MLIVSADMPVDDLRSGTWVTYIGGRATGMRLRRCRVEIVAGADAGLVRDIEAPVIRIGARRGNDVQLTDAKVSGVTTMPGSSTAARGSCAGSTRW
jgi:hypothetical protein